MKMISKIALICLLAAVFSQIFAQNWSQKREVEMKVEGEPFNLAELGAVIVSDGESIKFLHVSDAAQRPAAYRDIDAKSDDEVLMMNGKRIRDTASLKKMYDELAIGDAVKIGVRRGEQMFILDFPKIDPKDAPKMMMRMVVDDGSGNTDEMTFGAEDIFPAMELQMLFTMEDGKLIARPTHEFKSGKINGLDITEGDVITAINDKTVESLDDFRDAYTAIAVGETIKLSADRNSKTVTSNFKKPEPVAGGGRMMIKRESN